MNYLTSSFSLQMIPEGASLEVIRTDRITIREWMDEARVGHEGTAKVLSRQLGINIEVDRRPLTLKVGDEVEVAQPIGNRVIPGTEIEEPELAYFLISVKPPHKCKALSQYWDDELKQELKRRKGGIRE